MIRREFAKYLSLLGVTMPIAWHQAIPQPLDFPLKAGSDREYWIKMLTKIAKPVLTSLSKGELKTNMPVESASGQGDGRRKVSHLEAFGRLTAGIAPWLSLGPADTPEGKLRQHYLDLTLQSLTHAVDPQSTDFMNFTEGGQPLVDAAFLAHGLLRAPKQLWEPLSDKTKTHLKEAFRATRVIKPGYSNWLLFSAMIEAALLKFDGACDEMRVDYAVKKHLEWYKGDGVYGDGPDFHWDYYNSFVIQPMLLDVVQTLKAAGKATEETYALVLQRAKRFAAVQERLISPEGTFPPIGRSLAYRCGAFQLLAQIALAKELPTEISPAQVRSGLTAVIRKTMEAPGTFDSAGWLQIGLAGHQPGLGETYISTGSLYLCTVGFLPLGLAETDEFWTSPAADWTAKKIWSGHNLPVDKALGK